MSLTTRLSLFFLAALALVLVGFSATLYALARVYLYQQVDERLTGALDMLDGAIDREPGGLEWDLHERRMPLGQESGPEVVRWEIHDASGHRVDHSINLGPATLGLVPGAAEWGDQVAQYGGGTWKFAWRRLRGAATTPSISATGIPLHPVLVLTVATSLDPMHAILRQLAFTLAAISLAVWLGAAVMGRWLCRRALAPVTRMASAARAMDAADLDQRLPDPQTAGELTELHAAFNGLLQRLQEAFERQRRFTGDASHQLRTPLTAMLGQVDVALRRDRPAEEYRRVLTLVHGQADHLRRIVEALLFLARAGAESGVWSLEPVNLADWVPLHLKSWADHARATDLHVECRSEGDLEIQAQPLLLGQLLDNLLDNACKYSSPATPITVFVAREANVVTLTVEDRGEGIAAEDLPHVFEAFYRSAEARRLGHAGIGLGLATAQRIAAALGGSLVAASESGRGSRFTLRLTPHGLHT
jgi:two-component system OmpR family sensor kinase